MDKEKTKKQDEDKRLATDAQVRLAGQLEREIDYSEAVPDDVLHTQTRSAVSDYIHKLKEIKIRDQALRALNQRAEGFDKIGFGMVYKLIWKAAAELPIATKQHKQQFIDAVIGEYKLFKEAQSQCREFVQDGGLK